MLFHVVMNVRIPLGFDPEKLKQLQSDEHERAKELQLQGKWLHLWRVAGKYANVSVFEVESRVPRNSQFALALSVDGGRGGGSLPSPGFFGIPHIDLSGRESFFGGLD
jgi:muconolactone delta-isomerase